MLTTETNVSTVRWCSNCVSMSTRPRISFDGRGWCNACQWTEAKASLDWDQRNRELHELLAKHRRQDGRYDCLVPVSGGKDGSYVSYCLRHRQGMHPLAVTVTPPLPLELGESNLRAFVRSGYSHISVNPPYDVMRKLNRLGLIEMGFPYYGWLIAIHTAVLRVAIGFGIGLIFYGEDGEVEYGGSTETIRKPVYSTAYQKKVYLEGGYDKVLSSAGIPENDRYFFCYPDDRILADNPVDITHWSYFENWDPYRNYLVAKEHCGLQEAAVSNVGTFTNFAQNDQALYALHTYLMYLKFGFGRANQDACIEVRRGAMDRQQAVNLVRLYDNQYPEQYVETYLDYFQMDRGEFEDTLDRWANRELFVKQNGRWRPNFEIV
jgi:N-acetyl sugar amidotransferase